MSSNLRISQLSIGQKIIYDGGNVTVIGMKSRSIKIKWECGFEEIIKYKYKHSVASDYKISKI